MNENSKTWLPGVNDTPRHIETGTEYTPMEQLMREAAASAAKQSTKKDNTQ